MSNQHQEINIQTGLSRAQLKIQFKKNQSSIQSLSSSVKKKREEMKKMSDNMTKIIEKKLISKNSSQPTLGIFNPQYKSQAVKSLHSQREQVFGEIARYKQEIEELRRQQQPQIMSQQIIDRFRVHRKQALIENLHREYNTALKEKQLISEMLLKNKKVIDNLKQSPCIKEIQMNEKQLETLRRQIKDLDREILFLMNEDIKITMYSDKMQAEIKSFDQVEDITGTVDPVEIWKLIQEIKVILEDRRIIERKFVAQKEDITQQIRQISQQNSQIQRKIRQIANQKLKEELERKKNQLLLKSKSMPQMALKQKSPRVNKYMSRKQINFPSLLLSQPSEMKKQRSRIKESDTYYIGVWKPENLIKDDVIQSKNIVRAISMKIRTKQSKIIGVGVTYIDKVGVQVMGRSNIWKLSDDHLEEDEQEHSIDLQDVVSLYYYPNKQSENGANSSIGLKFMTKSSRPTIKVGEFLNEEEGQHINLENKYIKTIEFTLDSNYKSISGIKIVIQAIKQIKNVGIFEQPNEDQQDLKQSNATQEKAEIKTAQSPGKWLITTTQPEISEVKKKVFIKKDNNIRRLSQVPLVDHRLMLNRKKKMV